jgi:uncharacterized glyoxalase superfamily protein PhnB
MRNFRHAKAMAKSLREGLSEKGVGLTHSECLELIAKEFGFADWNALSAAIDAGEQGAGSSAEQSDASPVQFKRVIPIIRIFDETKAREFYVDFLGFTVDWEHRFHDNAPLYMQVSRGGMLLHLSEHHGDASPGSTVFVWMRGIADLHREVSAKKYRYNRPGLEDAPWDARVMEVNDPFGNRLRFSEPNKADDPRA